MKILSIHYCGESNIAYIDNNNIVAAVAEERFTRKKNQSGWPEMSINWLFNTYNINFNKLDKIIIVNKYNREDFFGSLEGFFVKLKLNTNFIIKIISIFLNIVDHLIPIFKIKRLIINSLFINFLKNKLNLEKVVFIDHHLAHASGAFFASDFEDSIVYTCDGKGDGYSQKIYNINKKNGKYSFNFINGSKDYDSLGFFYSTITEYLGFKRHQHEGKITGLAAYGNQNIIHEKHSPIIFSKKKLIFKSKFVNILDRYIPYILFIKFLYFSPLLFFNVLFNYSAIYGRYVQEKNLLYYKKYFNKYSREDVAAFSQKILEKLIVKSIKYNTKNIEEINICLSGGTFGNVRLNQKILELKKIKNVFIMPAMSDQGLALGAVTYYNSQHNFKFKRIFFNNIYLGPEFENSFIEECLKKRSLNFSYHENIEYKIAKSIFEGKIVGRFNGRLEWGPRALGNRSILAKAENKSINTTLNKRLNRTEFMPFAPSIIFEETKNYFNNYLEKHSCAKYMTITYNLKNFNNKKISAVIHIDNTARPQVVKISENESYYKIIENYFKLSGIPIIVNTSFNLHEEPIVCTPNDAIRAFEQKAVDILAIGNYWVEKN